MMNGETAGQAPTHVGRAPASGDGPEPCPPDPATQPPHETPARAAQTPARAAQTPARAAQTPARATPTAPARATPAAPARATPAAPARATRDALLVFGGRVVFVGLWYVAVLLVYKGLGADARGLEQAGLFAVAISAVKIASGCLVEPVDLALMRRGPGLLETDPEAAWRLFRAAFWLRLSSVLGLALLLLPAAAAAQALLPGQPGLVGLVPFVVAAIIGDMLLRSVLVVLQAGHRFIPYVLVDGTVQTLRFGAILALWAAGQMELGLILACYAAAPFLAAAAGAALLPRGIFAAATTDRAAWTELFHFLKWMLPAMLLATFNERLDLLLVFGFAGAEAAGLYGAMLTLALAPDLLAGSLGSILQPRIVRMRDEGTYAGHLRRFLAVSVPACAALFLAALFLAEPVILRLLGPAYAAGAPVFLWLSAGTLTWLAVTPLPSSLVALLAPRRIAAITLAQSGIVLAGGLVLLPAFGPVGMAQTICAMRIAVALALLLVAQRMAAPARPAP
jgi:O-antigen/teichoic acid export membrane protein